ncbi:MAG: S49 family peptidase [Burkholderiaceae bacterium]
MSDIRDEDGVTIRHDGRNPAMIDNQSRLENTVLEKLTSELLDERKKSRRWSVLLRLLTLAYLVGISIYLINMLGSSPSVGFDPADGSKGHTAIVDVRGVIKADSETSAEQVNKALRAAFGHAGTTGVVLRINSPGGSPVQSGLIFSEIKRLRAKHTEIPLHAVIEEICASGGYYVAAAADKIHVDQASLVGSIGVLMDGFGFVGTMHKLGVERRLFTAGADKGFLDPFSPLSETQRDHLQGLLDDIHTQFIASVRSGRGEKLKKDADLFSGLIWTGSQSVELGLADAIGSVEQVARDEMKNDKLVNFSARKTILEKLAERVGFNIGAALTDPLAQWTSGIRLR